ncbi:hypothetical protein HNY73_012828 [Argiope bruennichi]|uniref:Uncharacterized protein n=1 Tax=Argiope bruennichi TaxID=94029 RepID=A0A8T0EXU5_ARGBR|nr:hypothetical protein HNY73_012828 [Argiope bruennichi]
MPFFVKQAIQHLNELDEKFNLPPVEEEKYQRILNVFNDYTIVMINILNWDRYETEYVDDLLDVVYKLDCKLCEGEMDDKLLEMFEENIERVDFFADPGNGFY